MLLLLENYLKKAFYKMTRSRLDAVYRSILLTKFFTKGWGSPENLKRIFQFRKVIANRKVCYNLIPKDYPVNITKDEQWSDCHIIEGCFESPFEHHLPEIMPSEAKTAYFQIILPINWSSHKIKPICIHLAGTGDHFFWRRRNLIAKPLLKESGIASILLENPFYGLRKPKDQIGSSLHNVCDIFIMGGSLIMECIVLLNWCEQQGFGPLGLTGLSMGGHMASLAATNWPKPIALVPCLSWSTASPVFTQGVMSGSINWSLLQNQYFSDNLYQNDLAKMLKPVDQNDAFLAGQHFAKHYPASMSRLSKLKSEAWKCEEGSSDTRSSDTLIDESGEPQFSKDFLDHDRAADENKSDEESRGTSDIARETAEEKAAAKIFPLNLISDKFKSNDTDALKGEQGEQGLCLLSTTKRQPLLADGKWREHEALQFMRGIMDECTHLKNFDVPVDTSLIIAVCAKNDAYVPREGCMSLEKIWPGVEIRYVNAGHVTAYLLHQRVFRSTIAEAFEKSQQKYPTRIS